MDNFIANQDNLARFISGIQDLHSANKEMLQQLSQTQNILQEATDDKQWQLADSTKAMIGDLKHTMSNWIDKSANHPVSQNQLSSLPLFWSKSNPPPAKIDHTPRLTSSISSSKIEGVTANLLFFIPLVLLLGYFFYSLLSKPKKVYSLNSTHNAKPLTVGIEDKLSLAKHLVDNTEDNGLKHALEDLEDESITLFKRVKQGHSEEDQLQNVSDDLEYLLSELGPV